MPEYFNKFQCIGGICEDNCCIGWDVEIDRETYKNYEKVEDKMLSALFRESIYINEDVYNPEIDYAIVKLRKGNRCPFLNEENFCKIQRQLGEFFLSNVCATYPRIFNEVNGVIECSATVSCPEVAKLLLGNKEKMRFLFKQEPLERMIVNYSVDTKGEKRKRMIAGFEQLRTLAIDTIQNRDYTLGHRMDRLKALFKEYEKEKRATQEPPVDYTKAFAQLHKILKKVNGEVQLDSKRYVKLSQHISVAVEGNYVNLKKQGEKRDTFSYIVENYLVNYMFQELFPIGQGNRLEEAYEVLAVRYILIQYHLSGISLCEGKLTTTKIIEFIQTFSKAVEHHHGYLEAIQKELARKKIIRQIVLQI